MQEHQVDFEINDDSDFKRELLRTLIQIRDSLQYVESIAEYINGIGLKLKEGIKVDPKHDI